MKTKKTKAEMSKVQQAMKILETMNEQELRVMFERTRDYLRAEFQRKQARAAAALRVGQLVRFHSVKYGKTVVIRIEKINRKTLKGVTTTGERWVVNPSLCQPDE